jgi:lysophospholipase L1-like esterase
LTLLALSIAPAIAPEADWVSILRGDSRLNAELREAQARGYYEAILTDADDQAAVGPRRETATAADDRRPPPGWRPFAESGIIRPVDGYLRWRMKPNLETVWNGARFTTNSRGYRTPEVMIPKPPGTYRIVVLGSSNTMGHGVGDDQMYVRLLETWLNSDEAGVGRRVEVVNLAVSSDSPSQNLVRLRQDVPELEPDWILNDVTVLDYSLEELHLHSTVRKRKPIPFSYIRSILRASGVSPSDSFPEFSGKLLGSTEDLLDGAYAGWATEAAELATPMTLLQLPRTDAEIENRNLKRMACRLARRHLLPMIDLSGAYGDRTLSEYRLSPWDKHPSVLGHRLIFEELRDALIRRGGGPGLPLGVELSRGGETAGNRSINPT